MRKYSLMLALVLALTTLSAAAQTTITDGNYGGGVGVDRTQAFVDSGYLFFVQSCFAGATTEPVVVDGSGNFDAAGEYGERTFIGMGYVNEVAVHFVGAEDTGAGTLDIAIVEDSSNLILSEFVIELDALVSLDECYP